MVLPASGGPPMHVECSRVSDGILVRTRNRRDSGTIASSCALPSLQLVESITLMSDLHDTLSFLPSEMQNQIFGTSISLEGMIIKYRKMFNLINSRLGA